MLKYQETTVGPSYSAMHGWPRIMYRIGPQGSISIDSTIVRVNPSEGAVIIL